MSGLKQRAANRAHGLCSCGAARSPNSRQCAPCRGRRPRSDKAREQPAHVGARWLDCCENFTHYPSCRRDG